MMLIYFEFLVVYVTLALSVLTKKSWILEPYLVFLGFKSHKKGYIVYNIHTRTIEVSRNVIFYENYFPFSTLNITDPTILAHPSITTYNPQAICSPMDPPSSTPLPPQPDPIAVDQPYIEPTSSEHSIRKTDRV